MRWQAVIPGIWGIIRPARHRRHAVCRGWQRSLSTANQLAAVLEHSDVVVLWSANPLNTLKLRGMHPMSRGFLTFLHCVTAEKADLH